MNGISIEDVKHFHAELLRMHSVGLPVELEIGESRQSLAETLGLAANRLAVAGNGREDLEEVIEGDTQLSKGYRSALKAWVRSGRSPTVLDSFMTPAVARGQLIAFLRLALVQPLVLGVLAYLALIYLCWVTVPKMEGVQGQLLKQPGIPLVILLKIRDWMPVWSMAIPGVALLVVLWRGRRSLAANSAWLPGGRRYVDALRQAAYSEQVADLLAAGVSLDESMRLSGEAPVDVASSDMPGSSLESAGAGDGRTDAADPATGQAHTPGEQSSRALPPMLHWATSNPIDDATPQETMMFAASTYRRLAEVHAQYLTYWVLPTAAILIGGAIVLTVALCVFLPVCDLLLNVAKGK